MSDTEICRLTLLRLYCLPEIVKNCYPEDGNSYCKSEGRTDIHTDRQTKSDAQTDSKETQRETLTQIDEQTNTHSYPSTAAERTLRFLYS